MDTHTPAPPLWAVGKHEDGRPGSWIVAGHINDPLMPGETLDGRRHYNGAMICESVNSEDARRIVACVNTLAAVPIEVLEKALALGFSAASIAWHRCDGDCQAVQR